MVNRESPLESLVTHATVRVVQKPLRDYAAQIFQGVHTQFPGRRIDREDLRYALVLVDHPNLTNLYVAEAAGFKDRHYDTPLTLVDTLAGRAILTNRPEPMEKIEDGAPFYHLKGETRAKSGLAIPLENLNKKVIGALVIEEVESEFGTERKFPFTPQAIANIMQIVPGYASGLDYFTQATIDTVTGVLTRRRLNEVMKQTLESARRDRRPYSIIIFDVDNFKSYNDSHGHDEGDKVLKFIGDVAREHFRGKAVPGRFGGEEYVVAMDSSLRDTLMEAEALRKKIELESKSAKLNGGITASFGVACDPTAEGADVFGRADKAMYVAKGKWTWVRNPDGLWVQEYDSTQRTPTAKNRVVSIPIPGERVPPSRQRFYLKDPSSKSFREIPKGAELYAVFKL